MIVVIQVPGIRKNYATSPRREWRRQAQRESEDGQRNLDEADEKLRVLDQSYLFTLKEAKEFPQFTTHELTLGSLLGKGGFSNVSEVAQIKLPESAVVDPSNGATTVTTQPPPHGDDDDDEGPQQGQQQKEKENKPDDDIDVVVARQFMSKFCIRRGSARYAIKHLRNDLSNINRAWGAVDMAIENIFLSTLWHPNIIKMSGYSQTERVSKDTFILLDRLYGTLTEKFPWWREYLADLQGMNKATSCCGRGGSGTNPTDKSPAAVALLQERLLVAYDLCSAIQYLHDRRLVYRDIKSQNMGFDIRGDLKLFDFGLCKSLEPVDKCQDGSYGYHLTIITGSIPYMAPEVAMMKPYDQEADVYSFAVLLWELMSLEWAYTKFDTRQYFFRVCAENHRERISTSWPTTVKTIIKEGWDPNPQKRPDMKRIGTLLREELRGLMTDVAVDDRTQHLLNKSRQSFQLLMENNRGSTGSGTRTSEGKSSARLSSRMSRRKSSAWLSSRMIRGKSSTSLSTQMKRASLAAGNTYGTDEGNEE